MKVLDCEQGSLEWTAIRCGVFSASNFDKLITTKGEPSKQAQKYIYRVAAESVSGIKEDSFQSAAMQKGIETEQEAVDFYELDRGIEVQKVGFCLDDSGFYGCSPDRLVGDEGLLEVKCPLPSTHVDYVMNGGLYQDYFQQVQGQLFITKRKWCDLMSYSRGLRPIIERVYPDAAFHAKLDAVIKEALFQFNEAVEKIRA